MQHKTKKILKNFLWLILFIAVIVAFLKVSGLRTMEGTYDYAKQKAIVVRDFIKDKVIDGNWDLEETIKKTREKMPKIPGLEDDDEEIDIKNHPNFPSSGNGEKN